MALSATTTLPHSVDSVAAVLVNEDFQRHVSQLVGGNLESFTVDGASAGVNACVCDRETVKCLKQGFHIAKLNFQKAMAWTTIRC